MVKESVRPAVPPNAVQREKRQHLRAEFTGVVTVRGAYSVEVRARDISVGGIFLELPGGASEPTVGAEVTLTLSLPGLDRVEVPGFVRWLHPDGFGVQFGPIGPRLTHAIGKLILQSA